MREIRSAGVVSVRVAFDETMAARIRDALPRGREFAERRMFGGLCFMLDGNMCCGITSGGALFVRVGPAARDRALARPHARPWIMRDKPVAAFVLVDPEGVRTATTLAAWLALGLDFTATLPKKSVPEKKKAARPRARG